MAYPTEPWHLHGQLWVSLLHVASSPDRPAGLYGVALVSYEVPSPLTYSELLVARAVRREGRWSAHITDIWVDSPDSRDGGRELWAIPKDLGHFRRTSTRGLLRRTEWSAATGSRPLLTACFTDVSRVAPRTPFRGRTWQQRETGATVVAPISGSARSLPCRGSWHFAPDGPLAWLAAGRQLGSVRMRDFAMSFGHSPPHSG